MSDRLPHFISQAPFDPYTVEEMTPEQERYYMASQWRMMWWRFKRHRLAVGAGLVVLLSYLTILVTEFLAPYELHTRNTDFIFAPPQVIRLFHDGEFKGPFVFPFNASLNMTTLKREYSEDRSEIQPSASSVRVIRTNSGAPFRGTST